MPTITLFASGAARALGFTGRARKLITQSFPSGASTNWTCPAGVTKLETAIGRGGAGSPPFSYQASTGLMSVAFSSGGGGSPNTGNNWGSFQGVAPTAVDQVNANTGGGIGGYFYKYADGTEDLGTFSVSLQTDPYWRVGSATYSYSSGWKTSGPVVSGDFGQASLNYWRDIPGSAGSNSVAFGLAFYGGGSSGTTPLETTYTNVAVTPGTVYSVYNVGSTALVITYYQ